MTEPTNIIEFIELYNEEQDVDIKRRMYLQILNFIPNEILDEREYHAVETFLHEVNHD